MHLTKKNRSSQMFFFHLLPLMLSFYHPRRRMMQLVRRYGNGNVPPVSHLTNAFGAPRVILLTLVPIKSNVQRNYFKKLLRRKLHNTLPKSSVNPLPMTLITNQIPERGLALPKKNHQTHPRKLPDVVVQSNARLDLILKLQH